MARPICLIAVDIEHDWCKPFGKTFISKVSPHARPYLNAMKQLIGINEKVGYDSGKDIVNRFLCNAAGWRGPEARRIKHELRELLK